MLHCLPRHPSFPLCLQKNNCVVLITERNLNRCGEQHLEEWVYIFARSACVCVLWLAMWAIQTHSSKDRADSDTEKGWGGWLFTSTLASLTHSCMTSSLLCLKNIFTALTQIIIINYSMMNGWQVQNSPWTVSLINHTDLQIRSRIVTELIKFPPQGGWIMTHTNLPPNWDDDMARVMGFKTNEGWLVPLAGQI